MTAAEEKKKKSNIILQDIDFHSFLFNFNILEIFLFVRVYFINSCSNFSKDLEIQE